ncbi:MAG: Holliday junction branch migration protein RuvA [Clostridiales bacterium]|nr:Holliday junction branch migration protein RuvA [Clostridiales bacterium]
MISHIKGTVEQVLQNAVVLDNNGMGYTVYVSKSTLGKLSGSKEQVKVFTSMQVKEDGITLYGFMSLDELSIFGLLTSVSGVGPKSALAMLDVMTPSQIMVAIMSDDTTALSQAPGVGKKTAQRISLELGDKIKATSSDLAPTGQTAITMPENRKDALDALVSLGYSQGDSMKAVMEVATEGMKTEQIIRLALKKLSRA